MTEELPQMDGMTGILILAGMIVFALVTIGLVFARLYRRASKEMAFVRTGFGGQKVVVNGGAIVLPVLHETIPVNMNTLRLEVRRDSQSALITRDRMRVDVQAEFYVRVQPTEEAIANAAQTLGRKTCEPPELKSLVEGKFVDALRAVAAEMAMEELHEKRGAFVQKVQQAVSEDLLKNGLELETVSLTGLDQTSREYFNPDNAFDAEGLTKLTMEIEERRKKRNEIEQDTTVAIQQKNLEAERIKLSLARDQEYARLEQERELAIRKAGQTTEIATEQAAKHQAAEQAKIESQRQIDITKITAERKIEEERIEKERLVSEKDIMRNKIVEIAEQERAIAIAEKSRQQSEAMTEADRARALAVRASEQVVTAQEIERAERVKQVELLEARKIAERDAINITVSAEADKTAAADKAEAVRTLAGADAERIRIAAQGDADAERVRAEAAAKRYEVDAEGKRALHEANNTLSVDQIAMQIKLAIINALPTIIHESVRPLEKIDGIKIVQMQGGLDVPGGAHHGGGPGRGETLPRGGGTADGNLSDQLVASALRFRMQAPLLDSLMGEIGMKGGDLSGLTSAIKAHLGGGQDDSAA